MNFLEIMQDNSRCGVIVLGCTIRFHLFLLNFVHYLLSYNNCDKMYLGN